MASKQVEEWVANAKLLGYKEEQIADYVKEQEKEKHARAE